MIPLPTRKRITPKPYYDDGRGIVIYHGKCQDILPTIPICEIVITDPPYGETTHKNAKTNKNQLRGVRLIDFSSITAQQLKRALELCAKASRRWVIATLEWRHILPLESEPPDGLKLMRFGVWIKTNGMPQISADRPAQGWEAIAYFHSTSEKPKWNGGGRSGNYVMPIEQGEHPTTKPLPMIQSIVERFSNIGDSILDPFMGSGTTLRAAKNLGRKAIGIEVEEKYCEIAARRLQQEILL